MMSVISETKIQFISCQIGEQNLTATEYRNFPKGIRSGCLIFWAFICDPCAFLTVALIFLLVGSLKSISGAGTFKMLHLFTYMCTYIHSLACQWSQPVTWCRQHHHHRFGLRCWSRGAQWWSTQRPGRPWASSNTVVENAGTFLNWRWERLLETKKGAKLGCAGRL